MEDFVRRFHSLAGTKIGERKKNLFLLLIETKIALTSDSKEFDFSLIQPKTPLEEAFFVDILIFFHNVSGLLEILKSENQRLILKVLKVFPWLLNEMIQIMDANQIVNEFFPKLSFTTKEKILTKLSLHLQNPRTADLIFDAVKSRYGMYFAAKLLPCVSEEVILTSLRSKIDITPSQLLIIIQRHPQITEQIFEKLQSSSDCKYSEIYKHVARTNIALFLKLKRKFNIKLGINTTRKVIAQDKSLVIQNASRLDKILHKKQVAKSLQNDFVVFYCNAFPKTVSQFNDNYKSNLEVLEKLPSKINKINLILTAFNKMYGDELWNYSKFVNPQLMELMAPNERKEWMVGRQRPESISEIAWICLMTLDDSIPLLRQKIALTRDFQKRAELVGCLVETCRINGKNKIALLEVCKYVIQEHRSDDFSILACFLDSIKNCFVIQEISEEHWKYINVIIKLFIARDITPYRYQDWYFEYLYFRFKNGQPIRENIKEVYLKLNYRTGCLTLGSRDEQIRYDRYCLTMLDEIIHEIKFPENMFDTYYIGFVNMLLEFNKKYPQHYIDILEYNNIYEFLMKHYESTTGYSSLSESVIISIVRYSSQDALKSKLLDVYFKRENVYLDVDLMLWLLKYDPLTVFLYAESITELILGLWYTLVKPFYWKFSTNYTHLEIPQKIIAICLKNVNNDTEDFEKNQRNAVTALSCLMKSDEFLNLIAAYYPTDAVMDVKNPEVLKIYKLQQAITVSLKNVVNPSLIFGSLVEFSKGDYTKFIQRSLYSAVYNAAEENIPKLLLPLTDRPVSIRKHVTYITFKVLDRSSIYKFLEYAMSNEKNPSIVKFLFNGTFRFFAKNPDDYLWAVLQKLIQLLHTDDKECFTSLLNVEKIPRSYLVAYLVFVWDVLDTFNVTQEELEKGKSRFLNSVTLSVMPSLPKEFCLKLVQTLFKTKEDFEKVVDFTCKYVIGGSETEQSERLGTVFGCIQEYSKLNVWNDKDRLVFKFIKNFCKYFLSRECKYENILRSFVDNWNSLFKPHDGFEEYLYLNLTLATYSPSLTKLGEELAKCWETLSATYTCALLNIFVALVKSFVSYFLPEDGDGNIFMLMEEILKENSSPNCLMLVIYLLPRDDFYMGKACENILIALENTNDASVQLALSDYYKDLENKIKLPSCESHNRVSKRSKNVGRLTYIDYVTNAYRLDVQFLC